MINGLSQGAELASRGNVEGFSGKQQDIIHLVSNVQAVVEAGFSFVFTDGHGIMVLTDFFEEIGDLDHIDWDLMSSRYWYDTAEDPDRKRRRQAEFLIYEPVLKFAFYQMQSRRRRLFLQTNRRWKNTWNVYINSLKVLRPRTVWNCCQPFIG
jgi:hypothetical protein